MPGITFQQAEIDHELVQLVQVSPSINALSKEDREKVTLRIFTFTLPDQLKIKDLLLREQEDLAKATPEEMHAHYMQMKEVYNGLKAEKASLENKVRNMKEEKHRKEDSEIIKNLEIELGSDLDGEV